MILLGKDCWDIYHIKPIWFGILVAQVFPKQNCVAFGDFPEIHSFWWACFPKRKVIGSICSPSSHNGEFCLAHCKLHFLRHQLCASSWLWALSFELWVRRKSSVNFILILFINCWQVALSLEQMHLRRKSLISFMLILFPP